MKFNCTNCKLYLTKTRYCLGSGHPNADIVLIGEAPGRDEDKEGECFVGDSGKLLKLILKEALSNKKYFFINTVLCRPTESMLGANRQPLELEALSCRKNVLRFIKKVNAKTIIYVGDIAERYFTPIFGKQLKIFHPAYILRKGGKASAEYFDTIQYLKINLN